MRIEHYRELEAYRLARRAASEIFERSKTFPAEERFSMTSQMRRSSRSVCTNIGEAWRRRRYLANFVAKLNDAEAEAEETRIWLEFAADCHYLTTDLVSEIDLTYDHIIGKLVLMITHPRDWLLPRPTK